MNSYRVLRHYPTQQGRFQRWIDEAKDALHDVELPYLHALSTQNYQIPDFLTPTPNAPIADLETEIERLRATPNDLIRKTVQETIDLCGESEILMQFVAYPRELLECLIEDIRTYWGRALAHHWPSMLSALESDVLFRARQLAVDGSSALLNDLYPSLQLRGNRIEYDLSHKPKHPSVDHVLHGEGLQLIPAIFAKSVMWQLAEEWRPMLIYQSRGTGIWWKPAMPTPDQSLEIALGEGRARVLRLLATPANTGEIGRQLQITAGAASQHLSRLNQAGLVEPH
ncbi:MAG: transcriptional regulator, partial [Anaerolineae bacterium]|nr:transcriptional regulator [Anaerolineae bacterium]